MRERFDRITVVGIVGFAGLMLLVSFLTVNPLTQAKTLDASATVLITESGFDPPEVTIEVGTTVIWTNQTQLIVRLKSGEPYRLYLPLIQENTSGTQVRASSPQVGADVATHYQNDWMDNDLAAGQSFTHTFTAIGDYPYFLTIQPDRIGLVRVIASVPSFTLDVSPKSQAVVQGQSATFSVALSETIGITHPVALAVTGLPSGVTAIFDPPTTTTTSTLTFSATLEAATGIHGVTVHGTSDGMSQTASLTLTVASAAFVPTTDPSGITLHLNKAVYSNGDGLAVSLEFGDVVPPNPIGEVVVASPGSGDVELITLQSAGNGRFTSVAPLPVAEQGGTSTPVDGTLVLVPGEQFAALYFIDHAHSSLAQVDEGVISAISLFAGGDTSVAPVSIIPDLALTDDERVPPPGAKPTGTLLPDGGLPVQIATAEVILFPRSDRELARFLEDTGGTLLATQDDKDGTLPAVLIAVEPSVVPSAHLAQLRAFFGEEGTLLLSNGAVRDMYAFLLAYQLDGYIVAANPRLQYQGAPALQEREAVTVTHTMQMVRARTSPEPCIPGDPTRPCVNNVPAVWAFTTLWGADTRRVNLAVLDMGFATNDDFRRLSVGSMVECRINAFGSPDCGPGLAQGSPTVGNSFFGGPSWHGTGVVTTAAGVVNNNFGAAGVGGQVAVPMLYKYDTLSYAFEIGSGIRKAVDDGAACINISGGYPCRILTNIGPDFNICTVSGRAGICTLATAILATAAATACAAVAWIPIYGGIACAVAFGGVTYAYAVCLETLAFRFGNLASPMFSAVRFAADRGVPVVTIAGNVIPRGDLPPVIRDYVALGNQRTEDWGIIPAMAPEAIVAGAVDVVGAVDSDFNNAHFFGNRVDIWAPIPSAFFAPLDINDPASTVLKDRFGLGGTSAAAPFIAGLITVMQALNPDLNPNTPALSDTQRRAIVPRIRAILTSDSINFTNAELVALGFSDQPIERRRLVDPLAAVQAAAAGKVPDLAALGYDTSLNFSELLMPNDTQAQALSLSFGVTATGSLIELAEAGSTTTPIDDDWFRLAMPATPANRIYETTITLRSRGDETHGSASLEGDNISWLSTGGGAERITTYRLFALPSAIALINVTGSRSVYKLTGTTPQLAVPLVAITQPTAAEEICAGPVPFAATASYRGTTTFSVPASAFVWTVSGIGPIGTGPQVTANLTPGTYTVTLTLFGDPTLSDTRSLTIIDCEGFAPEEVTITAPTPTPGQNGDVVYFNLSYDRELNLNYIDVAFAGRATDQEDGTLTGAALVWTTDRTDLQAALLGTGTSLTARIYAIIGCNNSYHEITLTATDSNGNSSQVTQRIRLTPLC